VWGFGDSGRVSRRDFKGRGFWRLGREVDRSFPALQRPKLITQRIEHRMTKKSTISSGVVGR